MRISTSVVFACGVVSGLAILSLMRAAALADAAGSRMSHRHAGQDRVRQAGPAQMKAPPPSWDEVDEASDESFPASEPPSTY